MSRLSTEEKQIYLLEKKAALKKAKVEAELEEQLEYVRFPSIMGWYFDGTQFATQPFALNEYYATRFNNLQEELDTIADYENDETFTEKARRNFWPPKWLGCVFRTRGVYLDFKAIKKDPPRTPPEFNFEHEHNIISIFEKPHGSSSSDDDDEAAKFMQSSTGLEEDEIGIGRRRNVHISDEDRYYFNEYSGEYLRKHDGHEYWFEKKGTEGAGVWKIFPKIPAAWYDFYFDDSVGKYRKRNKGTPEMFYWDSGKNCWKQVGVPSNSKNLTEDDYYFDEVESSWFPITVAHDRVEDYPFGKRKIVPGPRGTSGKSEDDFYYDGKIGIMVLKNYKQLNDYVFDPWCTKWRLKGQPYYSPGAGLHPTDYFWDDKSGEWLPIPEAERYKIQANDYHFDPAGHFTLRDKFKKEDYVFDPIVNIYRKKGAIGKSQNGLGPEDYYYDENSRAWHLVAELEVKKVKLEEQASVKRKICKGHRGKSGNVPDDYYYDGNLGKFMLKPPHSASEYHFDFYDEVWKKMGTLDGCGKSGLYPCDYYFDEQNGAWQERTQHKRIIPGQTQRILGFHDFYFDYEKGQFREKDGSKPNLYTFNKDDQVWFQKDSKGPPSNGAGPKEFYFAELVSNWLPIENSPYVQDLDLYYNLGGHYVLVSERSKNGNISDDYYFDVIDEAFHLKEEGFPYDFDSKSGAWLRQGADTKKCKVQPTAYFWDPNEGTFSTKKGVGKELLYMNNNSNLWTRVRRTPNDYIWNTEERRYDTNKNLKARAAAPATTKKKQRYRDRHTKDEDADDERQGQDSSNEGKSTRIVKKKKAKKGKSKDGRKGKDAEDAPLAKKKSKKKPKNMEDDTEEEVPLTKKKSKKKPKNMEDDTEEEVPLTKKKSKKKHKDVEDEEDPDDFSWEQDKKKSKKKVKDPGDEQGDDEDVPVTKEKSKKKGGVSWTDPNYRNSEQRIPFDRPVKRTSVDRF